MDEVTISGLSVLLDEHHSVPYLDLRLNSGTRELRAVILAAEEEWCLNVRDDTGKHIPGDGTLYPKQSDAIVAALLTAAYLGQERGGES